MHMKRIVPLFATVILGCLSGWAGQEAKPAPGALLPEAEEIALAESAGPAHIAKDATIYVMKPEGFVVARRGTNGFTCLVGRSASGTQEPMCFDKEGAAALLPRILDAARLRAQGMSREEIRRKLADGFLTGKYRAPRRAVVSYMLSCENFVPVDEAGEQVIPYGPHVMFYIPNLTNADIGANFQDRFLPFVVDEGSPHAIVIVPVGEDPSAPRCPKKSN